MIDEIFKHHFDNGLLITQLFLPEALYRKCFERYGHYIRFHVPDKIDWRLKDSDEGFEFQPPKRHDVPFFLSNCLIVTSEPIKPTT